MHNFHFLVYPEERIRMRQEGKCQKGWFQLKNITNGILGYKVCALAV